MNPEVFTISPDEDIAGPETPTENADGKRNCPSCGKLCSINKDGSIRAHKCGDVVSVSRGKAKSKIPAKKDIPANVKRVGVPAVASGIEFLASRTVANIVPCDSSIVPAEITDADEMVGPIVRFLWPQLPTKAQSVVSSICDHEDLILCALAWADYFKRLNAFTLAAKQQLAEIAREKAQNTTPTRTLSVVETGDSSNGIQGQTSEVTPGNGTYGGFEPFAPSV